MTITETNKKLEKIGRVLAKSTHGHGPASRPKDFIRLAVSVIDHQKWLVDRGDLNVLHPSIPQAKHEEYFMLLKKYNQANYIFK